MDTQESVENIDALILVASVIQVNISHYSWHSSAERVQNVSNATGVQSCGVLQSARLSEDFVFVKDDFTLAASVGSVDILKKNNWKMDVP
jgi:hypothetical protein